jgi:hypothetical protein
MADIIFPTSTAPGARPGEGSGRLINCYAEPLEQGARNSFARRRAPGLSPVATTTHNGCRGFHFYNGDLYVAQADRLSRVNIVSGAFVVTDIGALTGTKRVTFARNNKAPIPDIVCVTENGAFIVKRDVPPVAYPDGDLPQPISVTFIDGYFVFPIRDGRYFVSALNDTAVDALDFGKAESHPGGLLNAFGFGEQLVLFGPSGMEFWQNAGNATGTPFSRAAVFSKGLADTYAVAGIEEGFSSLIFVADDNGVYRLDGGYQPSKISGPDLDRLIEAVTDKSTIDVTVSVTSGHMWATVTGPSFSWTYELATGFWHERASYLDNHWRGVCSVKAFSGWMIGDRTTADVWKLDPNYPKEGNNPLVQSVISLPTVNFPDRIAIPRADFDMIVGQGLVTGDEPIETDPVCLISWSDDGGNSFGTPLIRQIGRLATQRTPVVVNRTGMSTRYGRVWRIDISDPVYVSILGGSQQATPVSN